MDLPELTISSLPALNACLNFMATLCLLFGYVAIKMAQKKIHQYFMVGALIFSALFLTSYVVYHYHAGSKPFPDLGWIKTVYLAILFPHIILAVVMVPFILATFNYAFKGKWDQHRRMARITFPMWLYVSITGIIIYLMLYQWFA